MSKPDEYRANHRMAGIPANPTKRPFGSRWRSSGSDQFEVRQHSMQTKTEK